MLSSCSIHDITQSTVMSSSCTAPSGSGFACLTSWNPFAYTKRQPWQSQGRLSMPGGFLCHIAHTAQNFSGSPELGNKKLKLLK